MKKIFNIISLPVLLLAFFACEDKPSVYEFPVDEYVYDIPDVPVTEDYVVGVSYDIKTRDAVADVWWNSTDKNHAVYTGIPQLGEYDLRKEPETLKQHLQWGKEAGIDFFVISWGGHGLNDTIFRNFEKYYTEDPALPKLVVRYDPGYRFKGSDTLQLRPLQMDTLIHEFDSLYVNVIKHDFVYKKAGVPVMVLCNFTNTGHIPDPAKFTATLKENNRNLWIMADLGGGRTSPERWGYLAKNGYPGAIQDGYVRQDYIGAFDAFYITDYSTTNYDRYLHDYSYLDYNYKYWQTRMVPLGKEYIPTVMPAYDDKVTAPTSSTYLIPRWSEAKKAYTISSDLPDGIQYNWSGITENPYKVYANVAKRNVGPSRIVMIFNWNDFGNGRNLEPTVEIGTDYLRYTKQFFKK